MTAGQGAALGVLALAGCLAVGGELQHHAARDAERAVLRLRTHRFDGSTRARISTWLNVSRAEARLVPEPAGLFSQAVTVRLERPGAPPARFAVGRGGVQALDAEAEAVVAAVRAQAAVSSPAAGAAAPAPVAPSRPEVPPVRPFVPAVP